MDTDDAFEQAAECSLGFEDLFLRQFSAALQRHTSCQHGQVQHILQNKLTQLPDRYATAFSPPQLGTIHDSGRDDVAAVSMPGPFSGLLEHIARQPSLRTASADTAATDSYPELAALQDIRTLCARIRLQGQIRRTLQPAPVDAGPLNSASLVHRSLALMRQVSPDYLLQFLSYLDTLAWMEQISDGTPGQAKLAPNSKRPRKRGRGKPDTAV